MIMWTTYLCIATSACSDADGTMHSVWLFCFPSNAVFFDLSHHALTVPLSVWFYGFPAVKSKITPFKQHPAMKTYPFNDKSPPNLLLKNGNIRPAVLFQCRLAPPSGGSDRGLMFCGFFSFLFFILLFYYYSSCMWLAVGWDAKVSNSQFSFQTAFCFGYLLVEIQQLIKSSFSSI